MKKIILGAVIAVLLLAAVGGAGGKSSSRSSSSTASQNSEATTEEEPRVAETTSADEPDSPESEYAVTINSARVGTDYSDDPCVFVTYTFTNVADEEPASFAFAIHDEVYQNGVQCESAFADTDGGGNYMTKVQMGSSIEVTRAYNLNDTTSDIEVHASELISFDRVDLATQTFQIA